MQICSHYDSSEKCFIRLASGVKRTKITKEAQIDPKSIHSSQLSFLTSCSHFLMTQSGIFLKKIVFSIWHKSIWVDKSIDGVLRTRTRVGRLEGADKSTELWRHPLLRKFVHCQFSDLLTTLWLTNYRSGDFLSKNLSSDQCDQIGLFMKVIAHNCSC